jgi:hypothetical protein
MINEILKDVKAKATDNRALLRNSLNTSQCTPSPAEDIFACIREGGERIYNLTVNCGSMVGLPKQLRKGGMKHEVCEKN